MQTANTDTEVFVPTEANTVIKELLHTCSIHWHLAKYTLDPDLSIITYILFKDLQFQKFKKHRLIIA